jgi:hypothetical protein
MDVLGRGLLVAVGMGAMIAACKPPARRDAAADPFDDATDVPVSMTDSMMDGARDATASDVVPSVDIPLVDNPVPPPPMDVPRDVTTSNPCAPGSIIDLTAMATSEDAGAPADAGGPDSGVVTARVRYRGNNTGADVGESGGIVAPTGAAPLCTTPAPGRATAGYQVALRYVMRGGGRVRASTANPGTDMMFDTVVFMMTACAPMPTSTALACNDDANGATVPQSTAMSTVRLAARTEVFVFVGGYTPPTFTSTTNRGNFELTVEEVQ